MCAIAIEASAKLKLQIDFILFVLLCRPRIILCYVGSIRVAPISYPLHALIKLPGRWWISFQREKYVHSCSNLFHEHIQIHIWNILTRTASQNTQFSSLQTTACVYVAFGFDENICCAMRKRRRGEKTGRIKGKSPHSVCHLGNAHSNADTTLTARANQTFCTAYYYGVLFITF